MVFATWREIIFPAFAEFVMNMQGQAPSKEEIRNSRRGAVVHESDQEP